MSLLFRWKMTVFFHSSVDSHVAMAVTGKDKEKKRISISQEKGFSISSFCPPFTFMGMGNRKNDKQTRRTNTRYKDKPTRGN